VSFVRSDKYFLHQLHKYHTNGIVCRKEALKLGDDDSSSLIYYKMVGKEITRRLAPSAYLHFCLYGFGLGVHVKYMFVTF
jgi:hypothetical protein